MQEDLLSQPPGFKLYKDRAIYVGTFLGGPLVAGYLAAENFKQLGQTEKVKGAWIVAIVATIAIIGLVFVPGIEKLPRIAIPLAYTLFAQAIVQKYQGPAIKEHVKDGGQLYSVWRAVWVGLVGFVIFVGIIFALLMMLDKELLNSLS